MGKEPMSTAFNGFITAIPSYIELLNGNIEDETLDYSLESLEILENHLSTLLDSSNPNIDLNEFFIWSAAYIGEMVKSKLNGEWALDLDIENYEYGYPMIVKMDGFDEDYGYCPFMPLFNFKRNRRDKAIRTAVEYLFED